MEGNASVYQVYPVSRIAGEGRAEVLRVRGLEFEEDGAGVGGRNQSMRGSYNTFKRTNLTVVVEGMHQLSCRS